MTAAVVNHGAAAWRRATKNTESGEPPPNTAFTRPARMRRVRRRVRLTLDGTMEITEELVANIRSSIREHLKMLADTVAQLEYERNVPIANVPAELICGWFDDSYLPENPAFQVAFTPQELDALGKFNDLFAAATAELPEPLPRLSDLQALPAWRRVISGAASALLGFSGRAV